MRQYSASRLTVYFSWSLPVAVYVEKMKFNHVGFMYLYNTRRSAWPRAAYVPFGGTMRMQIVHNPRPQVPTDSCTEHTSDAHFFAASALCPGFFPSI